MVFQHMGQIYHCGCVNDQYLSPYQTRAKWLPWLLRKSRPFIFIYRPQGPIYFNIWGIFTIVGVWMIITYHHTTPEPIGCLGCWEKAGPLYFNIGPLGPNSSNYGAYLPLWVCGWSLPITIPNQSHVAALVAKKKQALCILYRPMGPLTFICGAKMVIHFHSCIIPHTCVKFGPWAYRVCRWSLPITIPNQSQVAALVTKKKQDLCIFIWAPGALDLHLWGQKNKNKCI